MRVSIAASITLALLLAGRAAAAQAPLPERTGTVRVVVRDATELPIRDAEVTLSGNGAAATIRRTDDRGEARFEDMSPGEYSGRVTSAGFSPFEIAQFALRPRGRVTRDVTLQIASLFEDVNVRPGTEEGRLRDAFVRQLTADELAALPEDPEELARVLTLLAGDGADIRVDGFKGGRLPLGTQIQEVRIRHDAGAASRNGGARVEIRTTPGGERWRNTASMTLRDEALNARDPFSLERPTGQTRQYSWSLNGPLVRNQTGLSVTVDGSQSMDSQSIRAATPGGVYAHLIDQPSTSIGLWTRLDHQISPEQAFRLEFKRSSDQARNQGIGSFDLPERAYTSSGSTGAFHVAHHATLRRGYTSDLRFALEWDSNDTIPLNAAKTIRVLDAFTGGGADQQGGQRSKRIEIEHETEFAIGQRHGVSAGANVDGAHYRGNDQSNAAGTYTFSSLAAFEAGQPATFTQRVGDPTFRYSLYRFGWYLQDDYLLRPNIMINLGVRHDFQTHMRDWVNFSPRLGINWTPSATARTTFRASAGVAHSQLDASTYQQLLLVDGVSQRDVVISNPGYPDPLSAGITEAATPTSIIRGRRDLIMPSSRQYSFGVDQPIGPLVRLRGMFLRNAGQHLFRSRNANEAADGVRLNPAVLNITELETTARSLTQSFRSEVILNYPPRRLSANVNYVIGEMMNDTDGPFSLPPDSVDLTREWGPSSADARHALNVALNSDLIAGIHVAAFFRAQSPLPYNVTLGTDPNGDGVFNERPEGVTRNSARGSATRNLDLMLTWRVGLGQGRTQGAVVGSGHRRPGSGDDPFRVEVFAYATNVLNLVNTLNVSGILTSPFFGLPTSASTPRRLTLGTRVWF